MTLPRGTPVLLRGCGGRRERQAAGRRVCSRLWGKLLPEVPLGQDRCVQRVHGLGVVAQASHRGDVPKLPLLEEALGLVQGVLLLGQEQLLPHVVLKLVL